jgi:hypothetical protein
LWLMSGATVADPAMQSKSNTRPIQQRGHAASRRHKAAADVGPVVLFHKHQWTDSDDSDDE